MGAGPLSDVPPPPPGFSVVAPSSPPRRKSSVPPPPDGFTLEPGDYAVDAVHDGDTLTVDGGHPVRLWGVDAPELKQQGLGANNAPVAIGAQSRAALEAQVRDGFTLGPPQGSSYGRTVAPMTLHGADLAERLARDGAVMAAPSYLSSDPKRRFRYLQAERLARQNGLGIHDTTFQPPAAYRKSPLPVADLVPEREQYARWWDTPTKQDGMRPEVEKRFVEMQNDFSIPAQQVADWVKANGGFIVNPTDIEHNRALSKKWNKPIGMAYKFPDPVLTDQGDGVTGAATRGLGNGVLPNWLEETGAIADTLGATSGRENVFNSDRRLADIWANNAAQNESITGYDSFAHPYATAAGQIVGGVILPMGKIETAADLAKWGAAYGFAGGAGRPGSIPERLTSGVIGTGEGVATTVLGGKLLEKGVPYLRAKFGKKGEVVGEAAVDAAEGAADGSVPRPVAASAPQAPEPVKGWEEFRREGNERFLLFHGPDGKEAHVHLVIGDDGVAEISVDPFSRDPNRFGPAAVRQAAQDLKVIYPEIKAFRGERESGSTPGRTQTIAMDAEPTASVSADAGSSAAYPRPAQRLDQPLTDPALRTVADGVRPGDVVPIPSNEIGSAEEAAAIDKGRFGEAKAPDPRAVLDGGTVRGWNGSEVPVRGPVDLVGWVRQNGGLRDHGGELGHMGLDNRGRSGMDLVGQEARFGPLIHDGGMSFDDAALRAWEAGYFPGHPDRPDVNEFLDALRGTHEGWDRRFTASDYPQLEAYRAAQDERHALDVERGNAPDGKVWADKSEPAGPDAPFPPVSAYEEWPAGGPDFAGNINLNRLDSPQDIKRALDFTNRRFGGFDAATRGRITHAETEALAADLNMTPESLLARRKGQAFNAEEALAARQILAKSGNELVNAAKRLRQMGDNPGSEALADFRAKLLRHRAIQEQVAGATAEAGRALQAFRLAADSRAIRGEVLDTFANAGGGKNRILDAADALIDAAEVSPGQFNTLADKLTKPKWIDKAVELRYFMLLSGPQTHAANIISNTLTALGQVPEHAIAAGLGATRALVKGGAIDRVTGTEVGQRAFGLVQGFKDGMRQFARTLRTGETSDHIGKIEGSSTGSIGGIAGKITQAPMRALSAEDELFKAMARRMELSGLAARQAHNEGLRGKAAAARIADLIANPPEHLLDRAFAYGRYLTFQKPLSGMAQSVSMFVQRHPGAKFIVPFVRTPANLLRFAAERSPVAPLLKEWRADFLSGGARRDLAVAKATVGTAVALYAADLARSGIITGSAPDDRNKANLERADGWQPYSVRIGDRYFSFNRLDPFAVTLGTAADMATKRDGMTERQLEDASGLLVASVIKAMGDRTWLSGLSDFLGAMSDPQRNGPGYIKQQSASSVVPAGLAQVARTIDPVRRETHGIGEEIQARLPGLSSRLYPQRDIWGQPVVNDRLGPDSISPITTTTARHDPVNAAMLSLGSTATKFPKQHIVGGKRVDYTPGEYDRLSAVAGQGAHDRVSALVTAPGWSSLTPDAQRKAIKKAIDGERKEARGLLGSTPAKGGAPVPPPPGSTVEGEAGGRNVYADLLKFLPQSSFTSGFRTREYQQDMKRRGYHPADNSHHLDGSSFDLKPPPGKSMGWLSDRLRKYDPAVRLLPEGDHLHTTFPGYYGAPPLDGAKRAGLKNPLAGMPPPPPGFTIQ